MKATILARDLVKLIAKHGDLDVKLCVVADGGEHDAELLSIDELRTLQFPSEGEVEKVTAFEIYGEES